MLPELKVLSAAGLVLAQGNGVLCYEPAYQPGDVLELTAKPDDNKRKIMPVGHINVG